MWNSNSLIAWLLASSGHDVDAIGPPEHGRAPGWSAGLVVARNDPIGRREPWSAEGPSAVRPTVRPTVVKGCERDGRATTDVTSVAC
jgi:hypothetical protein